MKYSATLLGLEPTELNKEVLARSKDLSSELLGCHGVAFSARKVRGRLLSAGLSAHEAPFNRGTQTKTVTLGEKMRTFAG